MLSFKDRRRGAVNIAAEIEEVGGQPVSAQTIRCTLHQIGVHGSHSRRKPQLKTIHKKASKQFAEDMSTKLMDYWNHVLWSDEMKINLFGSDGFKHVWRRPGEEYKDKCVMPKVRWWDCHGLRLCECCSCWRVIFHWGKRELQHVLWNTAAEHDPHLQKLGSRAVFQYDNGPKHTSKTTIALLKRLRVKVMDWPSMFPDEPNRTSLGYPQAEGGSVQSLKYLSAPRRRHGGMEQHSRGYLWSSGKLHAQESKGNFG